MKTKNRVGGLTLPDIKYGSITIEEVRQEDKQENQRNQMVSSDTDCLYRDSCIDDWFTRKHWGGVGKWKTFQ